MWTNQVRLIRRLMMIHAVVASNFLVPCALTFLTDMDQLVLIVIQL